MISRASGEQGGGHQNPTGHAAGELEGVEALCLLRKTQLAEERPARFRGPKASGGHLPGRPPSSGGPGRRRIGGTRAISVPRSRACRSGVRGSPSNCKAPDTVALPGKMPKMAEASRLFRAGGACHCQDLPRQDPKTQTGDHRSCRCSSPPPYIRKETDRSDTSKRGRLCVFHGRFLLFLGAVGVQNGPQGLSQTVNEQHRGHQRQSRNTAGHHIPADRYFILSARMMPMAGCSGGSP